MADWVFTKLYKDVFADLTVDATEAKELHDKFEAANPPPDKLVSLRAMAFRIGSEFLSTDGNKDTDVAVLRAINAVVHALEKTCMLPKPIKDDSAFNDEALEDLYRQILTDGSVDQEESKELLTFFQSTPPPVSKLVSTRANAFRIGSEMLTEDKAHNVGILRAINVIVHTLEITLFKPKVYVCKVEPPPTMNVSKIGVNASIEKAVQHIWDLDVNRLTPGVDYVIDVQQGKKPYWKGDNAADPLFVRVNERVFRRPTYRTFIALLDNYKAEVGAAEVVTSQERAENKAFLKAIMQTGPMQFCHKYCRANKPDIVPADQTGFINLLHKIWFDLYSRSRGKARDSSGFEHVFVGEIKDGQISGFHNWIQLYLEEKKGNVDYKGYIKPRNYKDAETNGDDHVLTLQFSWNGVDKTVGTDFIGVSPEFEMALYTMCFLVGKEDNKVRLETKTDIFDLNIKCYTMARDKIGTSYPEALSHEEA
uniref:EndoU domain-containing protein n=2 Tax=Ditylum brightwellii TaxID=49249 RepID=A0A6V2BXJ5_9STRA|mmetsp:Transcript_20962/g.27814  ORF Transcript_20962/g.27814 Transcript_20962/m.27814 type:complete len:479 (-) Transcript_20962:389-1825(-)